MEVDFWRMTPRMLFWMGRRYKSRRRQEEYFVGLLCSVAANYSMRAPKEALVPADFMASELAKRPRVEKSKRLLSQDQIAGGLRSFFGSLVRGD